MDKSLLYHRRGGVLKLNFLIGSILFVIINFNYQLSLEHIVPKRIEGEVRKLSWLRTRWLFAKEDQFARNTTRAIRSNVCVVKLN